jgi:hypothetical protein
MLTIPDALARAVATHGHAPFVTFYDDVTGERTELSYATFANWTAKTANLLAEELDVGPGDAVLAALGTSWTTAAIAFACWQMGACVVPVDVDAPRVAPPVDAPRVAPPVDAPRVAPPVDAPRVALPAVGARVAFVREDVEAALGDELARLDAVVAVGTGLGGRLTRSVHADGYAEQVLAFADDYLGPAPASDADAILTPTPDAEAAPRLTQAALLAAADAAGTWALSHDDRVLSTLSLTSVPGLMLLLGACVAGASTVIVRGLDPATLQRKVADERVTLAVVRT